MGFYFDFYRTVRWYIGLNRVLTFIGDLAFSFIALLLIYYFAQKANYLELRFYLFGGTLLGLLIYLRFFSPASKKLFRKILKLLTGYKNLVVGLIAIFFKGIARILTLLMSIPYGLLCWFSLLIFRMGEALGKESVTKVKARITKIPRQ
mgnify:CR=1 FL=1